MVREKVGYRNASQNNKTINTNNAASVVNLQNYTGLPSEVVRDNVDYRNASH